MILQAQPDWSWTEPAGGSCRATPKPGAPVAPGPRPGRTNRLVTPGRNRGQCARTMAQRTRLRPGRDASGSTGHSGECRLKFPVGFRRTDSPPAGVRVCSLTKSSTANPDEQRGRAAESQPRVRVLNGITVDPVGCSFNTGTASAGVDLKNPSGRQARLSISEALKLRSARI